MKLLISNFILLTSLFPCLAAEIKDVNDVRFRGDSTLMNMRIENSYFADGAFLIETTGARFEYVKGQLKLYQGLDKGNRRLLSTITFDNEPNFIKVEDNNDHILFWSKDLNIGIYGDSTLIISPKVNQNLKCKGNFRPDYEGRHRGEILLIDGKGGMEIYPQRHEAEYEIKKIELSKTDWTTDYRLNAGERVMIAVFPGRPFNWEESFESNVAVTSGGTKKGNHPYGFGFMPPDDIIEYWSKFLDVIAVQWDGLWENGRPHGPYKVANPSELTRLINTAHKNNMKVVLHCSLFYYSLKFSDFEDFYNQVKSVFDEYGNDGVYIDGMTFDDSRAITGRKIDNKILNWEMIRRLRQLFGKNGIIVYHATNLGTPVATAPNIETYSNITLSGEGVSFDSLDDLYVRYQIRKYGISNSIAVWIYDTKPSYLSKTKVIKALVEMNGRECWNGYEFWRKNDEDNAFYDYYLQELKNSKKAYENRQMSKKN